MSGRSFWVDLAFLAATTSFFASSAASAQSARDPLSIFTVSATTATWEGDGCSITLVLDNKYEETMKVAGKLLLVDDQRNTLAETSFFFPSALPNGRSQVDGRFYGSSFPNKTCPTKITGLVLVENCFVGSSSALKDSYCVRQSSFTVSAN